MATLTVSDGEFLDTDSVQVSVVDTTPPALHCSFDGAPGDDDEWPDHGPAFFILDLDATDLCCGESDTLGVIDTTWAEFSVEDGSVVKLECLSDDDEDEDDEHGESSCGSAFRCEDLLELETAAASLIVRSTDCSGNVATCALDLCEPFENSEEDPVGEAGSGGGLEDLRLGTLPDERTAEGSGPVATNDGSGQAERSSNRPPRRRATRRLD